MESLCHGPKHSTGCWIPADNRIVGLLCLLLMEMVVLATISVHSEFNEQPECSRNYG